MCGAGQWSGGGWKISGEGCADQGGSRALLLPGGPVVSGTRYTPRSAKLQHSKGDHMSSPKNITPRNAPAGQSPSDAARSYAERLAGKSAEAEAEADLGTPSQALANLPADVAPMHGKLDQAGAEALMAELAEGDYAMSPTFIKLEPGDVVRGKLVDCGSQEITDSVTKQPKSVATWTLEDERGFRVSFLSSHQLDKELNSVDHITGQVTPRIGAHVILCRLDDERIPGGRIVGRWRIAIRREASAPAGVVKAGAA